MINKSYYWHEDEVQSKRKFYAAAVIVFGSVFFYLVYLFNLQIINSIIYEKKAREISLRSEMIPAQRGRIYDRYYDNPLAINIDSFAISIIPAEIEEGGHDDLFIKIGGLLNIPLDEIKRKIPRKYYNLYQPIELMNGVPYETIVYIAEHINEFPGVIWENKTLRYYTATGSIAHVLGYVGNITGDELQILYNKGYNTYSVLGKSGIEKQYDMILRGEDGKKFKTVDARGKRLGKEEFVPPKNGYDLVLTIDYDIQQLAEKALGPRKGSVVVLKPSTGEILALVSYPFYNPNNFNSKGEESFTSLSLNKDFPFLNRAIQSAYAPASSFKAIMTIALLEEKAIPPEKTIYCSGKMQIGNREFKCHKRYGHGALNLANGLAQSCNIYFGTAGMEYLGIDLIAEYAGIMGLGAYTGIDLPEEVTGTVPTPAWKKQVFNTPWTAGDTVNTSIGQGFTNVTALQMADVVAALVNDGIIYKPHLLKEIRDSGTGDLIEIIEPEILKETYISKETCKTVRDNMRLTVTEGTAKIVIQNDTVDIAGKTGTGEIGQDEQWHSWFISFGPYNAENKDDQIVVVTMIEASDTWEWWAPKAADIIFEGIFGNMTFEEVVEHYKKRYVWYAHEIR